MVRLDEPTSSVGTSYAFPPEEMFCLFTTSELIFEERMMRVAPTAQIQGAAKLEVPNLMKTRPQIMTLPNHCSSVLNIVLSENLRTTHTAQEKKTL